MRRNELKIWKTRLWSALLFGMLTSVGIMLTGCETFHTDVKKVELSARPDLDPTLAELELTGVYQLHDEDDKK